MIEKKTANCFSPPDGKMQDDKFPDWLSLIFHCNPFLWKRPKSMQVNAIDFTCTCKKEKEAIVHVHPTTKLCRPLSLWSQVSKPTSGDGKAVGRNTSKSQSSRFTPNQGSHCLTHKYTHTHIHTPVRWSPNPKELIMLRFLFHLLIVFKKSSLDNEDLNS